RADRLRATIIVKMPQFVHLADSKMVSRIARIGISTTTTWTNGKGVYCTPVSRYYFRTHQWLRELKRRGTKSMHAVQFDLPARTMVLIGRFQQDHIPVTAAEAAKIFDEHKDALGLEVIVPHRVPKSAIRRIYVPSQVLGWRFYPEAKHRKPFCGCKYCNRG